MNCLLQHIRQLVDALSKRIDIVHVLRCFLWQFKYDKTANTVVHTCIMSRTIISPVTPSCNTATPVLPTVSLSTLREVRTVAKLADVAREGVALSSAGRLECSLAFSVASLSRCIGSEVATAVEIHCAPSKTKFVICCTLYLRDQIPLLVNVGGWELWTHAHPSGPTTSEPDVESGLLNVCYWSTNR